MRFIFHAILFLANSILRSASVATVIAEHEFDVHVIAATINLFELFVEKLILLFHFNQ